MNFNLRHELSWIAAERVAEAVRRLEEEGRLDQVFCHAYKIVSAGLEIFQMKDERVQRRIKPSQN